MISATQSSPQTAASSTDKQYFLGVDVGGTNIKIGLVDDQGQTLGTASISTLASQPAQQAIDRSAEAARRIVQTAGVEWSNVAAAGLGVPGPMSLPDGQVLDASNLPGWLNFYAQAALEKALGMPVCFINDANAAALGEAWIGAGAGHHSLAMFTLGTGVGGGLISDGHLIDGIHCNSFGSEMGHMVVDSSRDARLCVWGGGRGQLEAFASASAVAAQATRGVQSGVDTMLCRLEQLRDSAKNGGENGGEHGGDRSAATKRGQAEEVPIQDKDYVETAADEITAKDVYLAAKAGDEFALKLVDEAAYYLGIGVTTAVHLIDPGLVLLGGAMNFGGKACPIGRRFLEKVTQEFQSRTFANVAAGTRIDYATLGGDAGFIGAAAFARQQIQNR